ncbi:MAG: hypothetical protein UZ09_BCD002001515 [Bacteroidetes bacterium OLB9]|nr:MAG: hypothetical protein UZ09_BCD002001515 [Bacteroidetes bacterium OLB9]
MKRKSYLDSFFSFVFRYKPSTSIVTLIFLCAYFHGFAQQDDETPPPADILISGKDSIPIIYKYVLVNDIFSIQEAIDTLADIAFIHRVSTSNQGEYINTGNYGSAMQSLIFQNDIHTGQNVGYLQYRNFQLTKDNFKLFEPNRPLADLFFSQVGSQDNISAQADFSRNFSDGLSVSLNYKRISQKGFYENQAAKATTFGFGLRYQSPSKNYDAILLFLQNANQESNNGGISYDSLVYTENFRKAITTRLSNAETRQQEQTMSLIQYFRLNRKSNDRWNLYVQNDLTYQPSYFKYYDTEVNDESAESLYFGFNDTPKGLRRYLDVKNISDGFYVHGSGINGIAGKVGLLYEHFIFDDRPVSVRKNDLTAIADGKIPFLKYFELDLKGKLGLLENAGLFNLSAGMDINIGKIGRLDGGIQIFRAQPSYRTTHLHINNQIFRDTSFSKPFGSEIHAGIYIPSIKLSADLKQSIINNPVYWDYNGLSAQHEGIFTITQLHISHRLKIKSFNLNNDVYFQLQSDYLYPLPKLFTTHQLYYSGKWFQAMEINIGLDGRLIPDYQGPAFNPLTSAYHLSDTTLPFFPTANFFVSAKVSMFRAFFTMENFSQYFMDTHNFDVVHYPAMDPSFRMGFSWLLKD